MKTPLLPQRHILAQQKRDKSWRIVIDGNMHPSDFVSLNDCRMFIAYMNDHGLYLGRPMFAFPWGGDIQPTEPMHDYSRMS